MDLSRFIFLQSKNLSLVDLRNGYKEQHTISGCPKNLDKTRIVGLRVPVICLIKRTEGIALIGTDLQEN